MIQERMAPLIVRGNKVISSKDIRKLLIRGTNWIGDAVMTLPSLAAIRQSFPKARISILAKPWVADVYRLSPHIDEIVIFDSPGRHDGVLGKIRLASDLHRQHFDAAILLQNAIEAAVITRLARIPIRAGYNSDARGWLLTHSVQRTQAIQKVHQTRYYLEMVMALGCNDVEIDVHLEPKAEDRKRAEAILGPYGLGEIPLIGMAPGATYGAAKKWYPERFSAVADHFADEYGARTLLFGSTTDQENTRRVSQNVRHSIIDLAGRTNLQEAMAIMARCRLFISNDSGLMHVAAALGIPTVAVFGSTNPITTGPVGRRTMIVRKEVACSPCLKTTCPSDFRCMEQISADEVYQAARSLMSPPENIKGTIAK